MPTRTRPDRSSAAVDLSRPFGAHLRLRWWVPVVLTAVVVLATYLLQLALVLPATVVESRYLGKAPGDISATPLTYLATNLAIILSAPVVVAVLARTAGVPWRSVLSPSRGLDRRRLGSYLALFAGLMVLVNVTIQLINPSPLSLFAVSGTTVALLVVIVLTTPLQAAAEEVVFRGAMTATYASWVRATRAALVVGIIGSSALFAVVHTSTDPWLVINYLGLGASTAVMALLSRGLEPAIAFHVMNNVFAMGIGALFSDGGGIGQDRSTGAGGPYMLVLLAAQVIGVLLVWRLERRRIQPASSSWEPDARPGRP